MEGTARVLERRQLEVFLDDAPVGPVLDALRPYRNPDGGFGHALEPDVRCPGSQPSAALTALGVLAEIGATNDPMVTATADWVASVARPDGGVAQVLPSALGHPRTPWMEPNDESSFLTFAIAGRLHQLGVEHPWLDAATAWSWRELESQKEAGGYTVEFALQFLDAVPDPDRAAAAIDRLRPSIRPDGTVPVPGGIEGEHIKPLELTTAGSPEPGTLHARPDRCRPRSAGERATGRRRLGLPLPPLDAGTEHRVARHRHPRRLERPPGARSALSG